MSTAFIIPLTLLACTPPSTPNPTPTPTIAPTATPTPTPESLPTSIYYTQWVTPAELIGCLNNIDCSGVSPNTPLLMYPEGRNHWTYSTEKIELTKQQETLDLALEAFRELFNISFTETTPGGYLHFYSSYSGSTSECGGRIEVHIRTGGCSIDRYRGNVKQASRIYLGVAKLSTVTHELVHALTPMGHVHNRSSVMQAVGPVDLPTDIDQILTDLDREIINFFLNAEGVGPGERVHEILERIEIK